MFLCSLCMRAQSCGEGNGNPLQYSCLENPRDGGAWWAAVYGVAQSWTRLKRLSSSSSNLSFNFRWLESREQIPVFLIRYMDRMHEWLSWEKSPEPRSQDNVWERKEGVMLLSLKNNIICPLLNLTQNVSWALTNFSKFPPIKWERLASSA